MHSEASPAHIIYSCSSPQRTILTSSSSLEFSIKLSQLSLSGITSLSLTVLQASACTSNAEIESNSYYGKWTLNKVVYDDGDFKDLSNQPGHFINIGKTQVSDFLGEYGVRPYPYTQEGGVLSVTYGSSVETWAIIERSEYYMKIDTLIDRYVLVR